MVNGDSYRLACWAVLQHYPETYDIPIEFYDPDPEIPADVRRAWLHRFLARAFLAIPTVDERVHVDVISFFDDVLDTDKDTRTRFWKKCVLPNSTEGVPKNGRLVDWFAHLLFHLACIFKAIDTDENEWIMVAYADSLEYITYCLLDETFIKPFVVAMFPNTVLERMDQTLQRMWLFFRIEEEPNRAFIDFNKRNHRLAAQVLRAEPFVDAQTNIPKMKIVPYHAYSEKARTIMLKHMAKKARNLCLVFYDGYDVPIPDPPPEDVDYVKQIQMYTVAFIQPLLNERIPDPKRVAQTAFRIFCLTIGNTGNPNQPSWSTTDWLLCGVLELNKKICYGIYQEFNLDETWRKQLFAQYKDLSHEFYFEFEAYPTVRAVLEKEKKEKMLGLFRTVNNNLVVENIQDRIKKVAKPNPDIEKPKK
jgi:hypothetical protein